MRRTFKNQIIPTIVLIVLYILIGNARSIQENPFIPGAVIAVNMIVPVIGGILFGRFTGLMTGLVGTALNSLTPAGSIFEIAAILPHAIMGFGAGYFRKAPSLVIPSFALILGHILNLGIFIMLSLIPMHTFTEKGFWLGIGYEIFIGLISIILIVTVYRVSMEEQ